MGNSKNIGKPWQREMFQRLFYDINQAELTGTVQPSSQMVLHIQERSVQS